jgi:hypothetical protein
MACVLLVVVGIIGMEQVEYRGRRTLNSHQAEDSTSEACSLPGASQPRINACAIDEHFFTTVACCSGLAYDLVGLAGNRAWLFTCTVASVLQV